MPFSLRSVSPVRISALPDDVRTLLAAAQNASQRSASAGANGQPILELELELFSHESLVNFIRQLSTFCAAASGLLAEVGDVLRGLNERCRLLGERVVRVRERMQNSQLAQLDGSARLGAPEPTRRNYSSAHYDESKRNLLLQRRRASHPSSADRLDASGRAKLSQSTCGLAQADNGGWSNVALFCARPAALSRMYERAQPPPALSVLSEYHDDRCDPASFYSDPGFYTNVPLPSVMPDSQRTGTAEQSGINADSQSECSTANAAPSVYDSAYATHSAGSSEYGSVRSGAGRTSTRAPRDELVSTMRQVRLEQSGLLGEPNPPLPAAPGQPPVPAPAPPALAPLPAPAPFPVPAPTSVPAPTGNGTTKQKSVNFNLNVNVVGLAPSGSASSSTNRSSVSSSSSSTAAPPPPPPPPPLPSQLPETATEVPRKLQPPAQQPVVPTTNSNATQSGNHVHLRAHPNTHTGTGRRQRSSHSHHHNHQHSRSMSQPPAPLTDRAQTLTRATKKSPLHDGQPLTPAQTQRKATGATLVRQQSQPQETRPVATVPPPVGPSEHQLLPGTGHGQLAATLKPGFSRAAVPLEPPPPQSDTNIDLKQAVLMNLAMNNARANVNYVVPGSAFAQPTAQMLNTIQSILTEHAIGDTRAPMVVQSNPVGVQLRSTLKLKRAAKEPQPAPGSRDRMSKELLAEIKKGVRLRQVSFADDTNSES